jgi:hypothetical protein
MSKVPSCKSIIDLAIASPKPEPSVWRYSSPRLKRSNKSPIFSLNSYFYFQLHYQIPAKAFGHPINPLAANASIPAKV